MTRAIVAAGGWAHPGDDIVAAALALIEPHQFDDVDVVRDGDALAEALAGPCDLLVVGSCWFSMTDARYSPEQRAEHGFVATPELQASLLRVRDRGCRLLALHTAVICFDGVDVWREWLGGSWNWNTSFHPPPEPMQVVPLPDSGIAFDAFWVDDELYQGLDVDTAVRTVARSSDGHPLVWTQQTANGRSVVNLLGHDQRSLGNEHHERLNQQLLAWLLDDVG